MTGYAPQTAVGAGNSEEQKYGQMWERPEYRAVAPGEIYAPLFVEKAKPRHGAHVIDFGAGTGRGALALHDAGLKVTMLDFVRNSLDEKVKARLNGSLSFVKHDLCNPSPVIAEYGYCTDVMEHVPPEKVGVVLDNILRAAKSCFFAISLTEDLCGQMIGETLHVTVQPFEWWQERLTERNCQIAWSHKMEGYGYWLVSVWEDAQVVVDHGEINAAVELIKENVRTNCAVGWQQVIPHPEQDTEVMILGGGPSMKAYEAEIREMRERGVKLVTLNGAYNWAIEHGITPSATVIVDARELNGRFTKPVLPECKYLLASQCHPSVFDGLPKDRTYLWHVMNDATADTINEFYPQHWSIPGGSTVLLRAIPLLRTLGYHRFHLFGTDSCLTDGAHHAYAQPENDGQAVVPIMVTGGRVFWCHPWMASQAKEFVTLVEKMGETFDMIVHGDGLLSHIINTGAQMLPEQEA